MCGIAAIVSLNPDRPIDPGLVRKMTSAMSHRGPDDEGYFIRPNVAFGHKRLSIIDIEGGKQPMSTMDKRFTMIFNGEVFNYKEHRAHLETKGVKFRTNSDTEVVLHGFQKYGKNFLDNLEGMFAGVLYDALENKVVIFRDPFGIKPLYSFVEDGLVFFASEIKALGAVIPGGFSMDESVLYSYFMLGYVPGKQTLLKGVERVAPGNCMEIDGDGKRTEESFSSKLSPQYLAVPRSTSQTQLREALISSIERSMVSDVPLGLYLSGGVDSSLIAAIAKKELNRSIPSYCISFPNQISYDESTHAKNVAQKLGIPLNTIVLDPDALKDVERLAEIMEEPMVDPSAMALFHLARAVQPNTKVVLSGEGGDELFGGYHRYFWDSFLSHYQELPALLQKGAEAALALVPSKKRRLDKLLQTKDLPRHERYFSWFCSYSMKEMKQFEGLVDAKPFQSLSSRIFSFSKALDPVAQLQWIDMVTFLRDGLLVKSDRMSMRAGVEVRVPFLQTNLVENAFALPQDQRTTLFETKSALRNVLKQYLPNDIVARRKQGFEFPLDEWFRGSWKSLLNEYLSDDVVKKRKWFSKSMIDNIKKEHASGQKNRGRALFSLVMLEAWTRKFIDKK